MATIHRLPVREAPDPDTLVARLARLLKLEVELGLAEVRHLIRSAVLAIAVAIPAAVAVVASVVVLIAAAFAPLFGAPWQHLVIAGGGVLLVAIATIAWSAWRLRSLSWPKTTLTSVEETWQWLGAQLRSRLTSR